MTIIERVARVLAGQYYSRNAEGHAPEGSAVSDLVDARWPDFRHEAMAVLKTLREPDEPMIAAARGLQDPAQIWDAMMRAAIDEPQD
jgi:hypothetical protein